MMKTYQGKYKNWIKTIAMVVVCLFLVNDIVWAYPDSSPQNSTLARWSAVQVLSDNNVNDPVKIMLEAVTGIEFVARGKPARVVNSLLTKSAHAAGGQRKIRFLEDTQRTDDITRARFQIVGEENKIFEIISQKGAIVVRKYEPALAQLPARTSSAGLTRSTNEQEPLYQAIRRILPELPEYYPLEQRYMTSSAWSGKKPVKRDTQVEYTTEGVTQTNIYADFFDTMNSPGHWPESNLTKDRIMADWLNRLVSLNGKTVIHYRSEYYPFFGLKAAEYGATSYLVDPRRIPYVEDLLLGKKKFSRKAYLQAEESTRQISPMSEAVAKYTEELLKLPPRQLIELIVMTKLNMPNYIWNGLTKIERNYYILKWIKDNPGFSLAAARYFSNKVFQRPGHEEKNSWWSLSKEEQLPYLLEYIAQNFLWAIRDDAHSAALSILRTKSLDSLPEELQFSSAVGYIYTRFSRTNWSISQDDEFNRKWHESLNEELLSPDPAGQDRVRRNITFMHGNELADLKMPDGSVDVIFSEYALNFVEDTVKFVSGVRRLLKPGGLIAGYIKAGDNGIRGFSVEELKAALMTMGFAERDIVIVEYEWHTGDPTEYLFFARKSSVDYAQSHEVGQNLLPFPMTEDERLSIPTTDIVLPGEVESRAIVRKDIVKNWDRDITLSNLSQRVVDLYSTRPQEFKSVIEALYFLILEKEKTVTEDEINKLINVRVNIDNLFRYLVIKYPRFQDLKEAINKSGKKDLAFLLDDIEQFYLIRDQIGCLLRELVELFDAANLFLPIDSVKRGILQRAETIGGKEILQLVEGIVSVVNKTDLPWDEKVKRLSDLQQVLAKRFADYNYFLHVYYDVEPIFYSKHEYPSQPPPNRAYILKGSIGDVIHVSLADVNGKQYYVDNVYRNIYRDNKLSAEFISMGKGDKRYVVYMDTFEDSFAVIQREYRRHAVWGALVKRQWGGISPSRSQFVAAKTRSLSLHEILHDVCPQMGEIPSYLAQIAYAPQPFEELFNKVLALSELEEGGDIFYIINLINPEARSPHYQGSRVILARYLKYALDNDKIKIPGLREIVESIIVFNEGRHELSETGARENRDAIIATLSLLSEEEVREIAKKWLKDEYDFVMDSIPTEVSLSLPMPEEAFMQKDTTALTLVSGKDEIMRAISEPFAGDANLPVLANNQTLPQVVSGVLDSVLPIQDNAERADRIIEVAKSLAPFNADSATILVRSSIRQDFPRAKALVQLAISFENMGNKAKATELLREAEQILASHKVENLGNAGPYSTMGAAYFLRDEIASLKQKLGLEDEAEQDIKALEKSLLPEGMGIEALEGRGLSPLIECAVFNKNAPLLNRIEEVVLKEDDNESNLGLKIQVGLAEAKIGNVERAHNILKSVAETEPRWANAKGIVEATLALADIGFAQEALTRMKEIQRIKDEPNRVGVAEDYLYIVSGRIRAKLGLTGEARQDFLYALESCTKHRYKGDDWAFLHIIEAQLEYKEEFLEDALQTANLLRDYRNRTEALIKIALAYDEIGNKQGSEEALRQALKMVENIEEDGIREIIKFRILILQQETTRKLLQAEEGDNKFTFPDFGRPSLFSGFSLQDQWRSVGEFDVLDNARKAILSSSELICHAQILTEPTLEQLRPLVKTGSLEIGLAKKDNKWFLFKGLRGGVIIPFNECEFRLHSHPKRITKEIGRAQDKYIYPDAKEEQDAKEKRRRVEYILTDKGLCAYGAGLEKPVFIPWRELLAANVPLSKLDEYFLDKQSKEKERPLYAENTDEKKLLAKSAEYLGSTPVNERIDLSVMPKKGLTEQQQNEQLERNMETLARQIAWHNAFGLNIRYILENDAPDKKAEGILKVKIMELGKLPGVNAKDLLSRIGAPHIGDNVIEVVLRSVENVKAMKEVGGREFVVALKDDLTKEGVAIPNFTAASAIGLSLASLRIAKEKEAKPEEYARLKDKAFRIIKSIYERYNIITKDNGFTPDDLEFMVTGCPENKLYYAILYALPPIVKDLVERIGRYHETLHLILQSA